MTAPWLTQARKYLGQREIPGPRHNAFILRLWGLIRATYRDDETPWCAGFVGGVLEEVGLRSTRSASSLSYLTWGDKLSGPVEGAIAVKRRKGGGHVTFVAGSDGKGGLWCIGGNQSDAVTLALYPAAVFEAFRWPSGVAKATNLPILGAGSAGVPKEA